MPDAAKSLGAEEQYTDYWEMLEKSRIDGVIIGTPMALHVPQALAAIGKGIHVLSEVPAGVLIGECRQLTLACRQSSAVYMMAENYVYTRTNMLVSELVRRGLFGTVYYAEGEYLHEVRKLNETTPWRRKWQTGINGITYGTHSLGPILQWMAGDRVVSVCCAGSGHHYRDANGKPYENEDSCVMLCRMRSGGLVKIRVDMISDRPCSEFNYQVQGSEGCYESARAIGERGRIWLRQLEKGEGIWHDIASLEQEFMPESWRKSAASSMQSGHGGGDFFLLKKFVDAALGHSRAAIGIDEAMDMTLPGLVSQQSILEGGRWIDVPDSRDWK